MPETKTSPLLRNPVAPLRIIEDRVVEWSGQQSFTTTATHRSAPYQPTTLQRGAFKIIYVIARRRRRFKEPTVIIDYGREDWEIIDRSKSLLGAVR
jgi:hypothetical protein